MTLHLLSHPIETYITLIKTDLEELKASNEHKPLLHPNLTSLEVEALKELTNNTKITIEPSDKGGGIVIMDTSAYIAESQRQLSDSNVYRELTKTLERNLRENYIHS